MEGSRNRKQAGVLEQVSRGEMGRRSHGVGVHITKSHAGHKECGSHWGRRGQFKQRRDLLLL